MAGMMPSIKEAATYASSALGRPMSELSNWQQYGFDIMVGMQTKLKTSFPDRERTQFHLFDRHGYNEVDLPTGAYGVVMIGTQIGRYVKPLAINAFLTSHERQPTSPFLYDGDNTWYLGYGNAYGLWPGVDNVPNYGYGNGGDYGDFNIDWGRKKIMTSPTFRYRNLVVKTMINCITPSAESCIHPFFYNYFQHALKQAYFANKGDANMSDWWGKKAEMEFWPAVTKLLGNNVSTMVKLRQRVYGY